MMPNGLSLWTGKYAKGYLRDSQEDRAMHAPFVTAARAVSGKSVDWRSKLEAMSPAVLDQGQVGACTAFACSNALRLLWANSNQPQPLISELALYYFARAEEGTQNEDNGARPSAVLTAIKKHGLIPYEDYPYDEEKVNDPVPVHALAHGFDTKGPIQFQTCYSADDIRRSIDRGFPVTIGVEVDDAFENWTANDPPWKFGGQSLGGHALCVVGYEPGSLLIVNSWGRLWGDNGYIKISDAEINSYSCSDRYSWQYVTPPDDLKGHP